MEERAMQYGEIRGRPEDFEALDDSPGTPQPRLPRRVNLDPEKVERGLVQLVLAVIELVRQLMEKQALRRIEGGSLTPQQVERLGTTLMRLERQMGELDLEARREMYFEVQRIVYEQLPVLDLVVPHALLGARERVENLRPTPFAHALWNGEELSIGDGGEKIMGGIRDSRH
jgi:hypothetical protein